MKNLKVIGLLMTVMLFISAAPMQSQAASYAPSNVMFVVELDDADCTEYDDAESLSVIVKDNKNQKIIEVPVEYIQYIDSDTIAISVSLIDVDDTEEMKLFDADAQVYDLMHSCRLTGGRSLVDFLLRHDANLFVERANKYITDIFSPYTIEIKSSKGDYHKVTSNQYIISSDAAALLLDEAKELAYDIFDFPDGALDQCMTFSSLIDYVESYLVEKGKIEQGETIFGFVKTLVSDDEEVEKIREFIIAMDEVLICKYSSGEQSNFISGLTHSCSCSSATHFTILHAYFETDADGNSELVGVANYGPENDEAYGEIYTGTEGDIISGSDYIECEYDGEVYEFVGSYDSSMMYAENREDTYAVDEYWYMNELDSYVLTCDSDAPTGLILRYEKPAEEEVIYAEEIVYTEIDHSPLTGNQSDFLSYFGLLLISAGSMILLYRTRKGNIGSK